MNLTQLELFYKEEWAKPKGCRCANLVETNLKKTFSCTVTAVKDAPQH